MKGQLPGQRQPTQWTATSASAAVVNEVRVRCVGHADADAQADAQADAARADTQADAHGVPYSTSPDTLPRPPPFARHGCCFVPHGEEGGTRAHRRLVPAFSVWGRNGGEADGGEASAAPAWRRICGSGPTAGDDLEARLLARSNLNPSPDPDPVPNPKPNPDPIPNPNPDPNPDPGPNPDPDPDH